MTEFPTDSAIYDSWQHWKTKNEKNYGGSVEEQARFMIYKQNYKKVLDNHRKFDKGEVSYKLTLNKFSDLTSQEFSRSYKGLAKMDPKTHKNKEVRLSEDNLPESFDWREKGAVTSVKNQG